MAFCEEVAYAQGSFLHSMGGPEAEAKAGGSIGSSVQRKRCVCVDISVHAIPVVRIILRLKIRNSWRMRTTTPALDTRPSFFAFRPIRHASIVANILREKFGPGDEAITVSDGGEGGSGHLRTVFV